MNLKNMFILTQLYDSIADFEHIDDLKAGSFTSNSISVNKYTKLEVKH